MKKVTSVAILGGGLSGAFAYMACKNYGVEHVTVFADRLDFVPPGPIVVKWMPKVFNNEAFIPEPVTLISIGNLENYMMKMNRSRWDERTTFPRGGIAYLNGHSPRKVLEAVFRDVQPSQFDGKSLLKEEDIGRIAEYYDVVFQTFPTEKSRAEQPPMRSYFMLMRDAGDGIPNICVYNGSKRSYEWTRFSTYWGTQYWEYSHYEYPTAEEIEEKPEGTKVLNVKDFGTGTRIVYIHESGFSNVFLLGRFATWNKNYESHDAYSAAYSSLETIERRMR